MKLWVIAALVGMVGLGAFGAYKSWQHEREQRTIAELKLAGQKQVNDSTVARLTVERASKDSLSGLLSTAKALNGKLIAGLRIAIARRDTVIKHDTLFTVVDSSNGSRTAAFRDSTFAGVIAGTITAPPFPQALSIDYKLTRPAFSPTVGFVQVGDRTVAVVTWAGERTQVEAPFMVKLVRKPGLLGAYVEVAKVLGGPEYQVQAGGILRGLWGIVAVAGVQQPVGADLNGTRLVVGIRKEF